MIQMKKQLLSAALVAAFSSALAINANAATKGTINFKGKIVEQTCIVDNNNANQTIDLGKAPKNAFTAKESTANATRFTIHLKNCTVRSAGTNTATKVKAGFSSVANVDTTEKYTLKNTAGANKANNVNIRLFNEDGVNAISPMKTTVKQVGNIATQVDDDGAEFKTITTTPDLTYIAKFYATNATVDAGEVQSSVDFELVYE
ncbi:Putative fimbrial protein [Haemophilus influenzae F3047]|uniref:Fimbrial protein n=2 Tax=Haemophilus influenzae TaxID=727 RepID=A0AAV2U5F2_HAEIF|nr:Putative fimbrial protein [Haemophilus influenzae F3047]